MINLNKLVVGGVETTLEQALAEAKPVERVTIDTINEGGEQANTVARSLRIKTSSYLDDMTRRN